MSYLISVSFAKGCYRHINISEEATLFEFSEAILKAFGICDNRFSHAFFMGNDLYNREIYLSERIRDIVPGTREIGLETLDLCVNKKFKFLYDFAERMAFQCRVLRVLNEDAPFVEVKRSVGEIEINGPKRYRDILFGSQPVDICKLYDRDGFPIPIRCDITEQLFSELPCPMEMVYNIRSYFDAAATFYGIIPLRKLLEIYNSQNESVNEKLFLDVAEIINHIGTTYVIIGQEVLYNNVPKSKPMDREIILSSFVEKDSEDYDRISMMQHGKPYKILPKKEFLKYTDESYYPVTPHSNRMLNYLRKKNREAAAEILLEMQDMIVEDYSMQEVLENLMYMGVDFDDERDVDMFALLYLDLHNNTRMYANRGYTPSEMRAVSEQRKQSARIIPFAQIHNRQADGPMCPCRSGKRFIECCGKMKQ